MRWHGHNACRAFEAMKVLIVGAGVARLAIGWRLADAGLTVEIVERGIAGRGATWASAGMIAPGAELGHEPSAMAKFARQARAMWPAFAAELECASGRAISYRELGSLLVAESAARARVLEIQAAELAADGVAAAWLPPGELRKREPLLSPALLGALQIAADAQVDNRALSDALCAVLETRKVRLIENCEVRSLSIVNGRARAAVTAQGVMETDLIVLASGAWMNLIGGVVRDDLPPIKPVKGQMATIVPPAGIALPQSLIWADDVYLVPRNGRLSVGATMEDASFDLSLSHEAADRLIGAAARLIPSIAQWQLAEMWAGLRPRTPDDAPVLGATAIDGLYIASGQFRNGILFAPAVADFMRRVILGEALNGEHRAFDPRRFAGSC
jgi:glycine oxidase